MFISPASPVTYINGYSDVQIYKQHVIDSMEKYGLKVLFSKNSFQTDGYLAGTDKQRADDINEAFGNKNVKAIIANR